MYIDKLLELETGAAAVTSSALGTNVVDLGSDRDIGPGKPIYWVVQILAIDATSADETYTFDIRSATDAAISSGVVAQLALNIPRATPVNTRFFGIVTNTNLRYLACRMALAGTTPSIQYKCWLTSEEPTSLFAYPNAV